MKKNLLVLLCVIGPVYGFVYSANAQCTPRALPFSENFSVTPFATCTPTAGGWVATDALSGAGWWLPTTNYAGGTIPEVEAYGDQANGGVPETIYLVSPPMNTATASAIALSFKHNLYLHNSAASGSGSININVEASQDSVIWTNFYSAYYNATSSLQSVVSETRLVNINGLAGNKTYIRYVITGVLFKVWGWEIDDINISQTATTLVPEISPIDNILFNNSSKTIDINLTGAEHATATLYDVFGKTIYHSPIPGNRLMINVSRFANGTYFLKVETDAGLMTKKIILSY